MSKVKNDGPNGWKDHYDIGNRKDVPRRYAVTEVKRGEHTNVQVMKVKGHPYVRDNPDGSKHDNTNDR